MTEFDENQKNGPFLKFFPKILCAYTKRHYLKERITIMMVLVMTLAVVAALFAEVVNVNKKISLGK